MSVDDNTGPTPAPTGGPADLTPEQQARLQDLSNTVAKMRKLAANASNAVLQGRYEDGASKAAEDLANLRAEFGLPNN
jgi:TATA-binding protein-associated factor Taf7